MTVVVIIFLPVVLAYQTWTYYVFRRRVSQQEFQPPAPPPEPRRGGADPGLPLPRSGPGAEPDRPVGGCDRARARCDRNDLSGGMTWRQTKLTRW